MRAREEWHLDLPTSHRIPLTWLLQHGGPSVRFRTLSELSPEGSVDRATLTEALTAAVLSAPVSAVTTRQQENGMWGTNFLGYGPSPRDKIEEAGTVAQYRRLVQLGLPRTTRPFRLAERLMFRTLSRDPDLLLYGEFADAAEEDPRYAEWYRYQVREGVSAALAEAGHQDDPRLRGSAHKVATAVSAFLRSPQADDALIKRSGGWQLPPDVTPPSWWSLALFAAMPALQRERAGFMDRLGQYLAQPCERRSFMIGIGTRTWKPVHLVLGDPIDLDNKGQPKDLPLALHFIELLASMGQIAAVESAHTLFLQLLGDLDADGVWHPKNLRSQPKALSPVTYHCWPLSEDDSTLESRQADITFRLALIAKQLGWSLEYS